MSRQECYRGALRFINERLRKRNGYRAVGIIQGRQRSLGVEVGQPKYRDSGLDHRVVVSVGDRREYAIARKGRLLAPTMSNRDPVTLRYLGRFSWAECRFLARAVVTILNGKCRITGWAVKPDSDPNSAIDTGETLHAEMGREYASPANCG